MRFLRLWALALVSLLVIGGGFVASGAPVYASHAQLKKAPHDVRAPKGFPGHVTTFACPCYYYGQAQTTVASSTTSAGNFTVWKPTLTGGDFHSLGELAVANSTQTDVVEVGWTVDAGVCGSIANSPCLFVYHWIGGVAQCYNGCGWVDNAANTTLNAGSTLNFSNGTSTPITLRLGIDHSATACGASAAGWWVRAYYSTGTSAYIGCYPDSRWSGGFTSYTRLLGFGEVAANSTSPTSQMGSGVCPAATPVFNTTMFIGSLQANGVAQTMSWSATDSTKYNKVNISGSSGYVGGDGSCP